MSILVSINCITYNHETYIGDAIESFLNQKTDFDFEILIGEDCSKDGTRKVIEKYVLEYPTKIKLITSNENVGANKNGYRLHQQSLGKYIALCEGDDYWTDPLKLQKQVNYMEQNPHCTLCFHNAKVVSDNQEQNGRSVVPWLKNNGKHFHKNHKYTAGELALLGYIPTASFLYPKHLLDDLPNWVFQSVVGDNVVKLITASHGYAYYMDEYMSVYRYGLEGSATSTWLSDNDSNKKLIMHYSRFIDFFDHFNKYSQYKFESEISQVKKIYEFEIEILTGELSISRVKRYKEIWNELSMKEKVKILSRSRFPDLYSKLAKMKISY